MFNRFILNLTEQQLRDYENVISQAISVDENSESPDLKQAYMLYKKAAEAHLPFAERRLADLTINGYGPYSDQHNFIRGIGYYLMAAEDGDLESFEIIHMLTQNINAPKYSILDDPCKTLKNAQHGDTSSRILLASYYCSLPESRFDRALNCLSKWALEGDDVCLYNIADILYNYDY